eukprot:CAMPEP_0206144260 /NCGR_PEP_ID=MMETSP1473-20131121/23539_1 /ASSEMBLY_ACC=CAM_ASM_001109 /TAXON_ID=1461547 /ORGANISM="Stichococcus sp, Strain RCC1054" /LENGTH=1449 /DNA_ID=CAMNT_0053540031 /DNA_START=323 /DNA_END=4672 /DNA_ORIENTATION=-
MRCTGGRSLRRLLPLTRLHARWQTSTVPHAATVSGSSSRLSEIVTALQYAIKYEGKEGWCNSRGRASSFAEAMADRLSKLESIIGPSPELTIAKQSAERYNELPLAERQALTRRVYTWVQALEPTPPPPQQTYQQHYNLPITQQQRQQQQHQQRYQEQQQLPYQQQHQQPYPQSYQQQPQQPYQQLYQQQQHQQQQHQQSDQWPDQQISFQQNEPSGLGSVVTSANLQYAPPRQAVQQRPVQNPRPEPPVEAPASPHQPLGTPVTRRRTAVTSDVSTAAAAEQLLVIPSSIPETARARLTTPLTSLQDQLAQTGPPKMFFYDLETTGQGTKLDGSNRILQIAVASREDGTLLSSDVLLEPGLKVSDDAANLHGITTEMAQSRGKPFREVWGEFVDVVERHSQGRTPVLVAHNGFLFDNPLVLLACWRDGVRVPDHWLTVDSLFVAKQLPREAVGPSLRLQDLNVHFGLPAATAAHQAWEDTEVLARVWSNLFAHLQIHEQLSRSGLPTGAGEEAEALATYMAEHAAAPGHSRTTAKHTTWADTWPNFEARTVNRFVAKHQEMLAARGPAAPERSWGTSVARVVEQLPGAAPDGPAAFAAVPSAPAQPLRDERSQNGAQSPIAELAAKEAEALKLGDIGEGETELMDQLIARPELQQRWRETMDNSKLTRGNLDLPANFLTLHLDHLQTKDSKLLSKLWKKLGKILVSSVWELLQQYPRAYNAYKLGTWQQDALLLGIGHVVTAPKVYRGMLTVELMVWSEPQEPVAAFDPSLDEWSVEDDVMEGRAMWPGMGGAPQRVSFQIYSPFAIYQLKSTYAKFTEGQQVVVYGRLWGPGRTGAWKMTRDHAIETLADFDPAVLQRGEKVVPVYAAQTPFAPAHMTLLLDQALLQLENLDEGHMDIMPSDIREELDLMEWNEAIREIHRPMSMAGQERARQRLAFDELMLLQLTLLLKRTLSRVPKEGQEIAPREASDTTLMVAVRKKLPFELTGAQDRALQDVVDDMAQTMPMMRLLQGDVGSGKTAVAFLSMVMAVGNGMQAALMAPTEILAHQHYERLIDLLEIVPRSAMPGKRRIIAELLTGSTTSKNRREILAGLKEGAVHILVGTHALLTESTEFRNLGMAVIDEQHRFGVKQRALLHKKANPLPHVLSMTATPIPRTLALVTAGDMALSIINELPPGRTPITTRRVFSQNQHEVQQMYAEMRAELAGGGRAFIVCPLVEASTIKSATRTNLELRAATEERDRLINEGVLGDVEIELVHGRLQADAKRDALERFSSGAAPVLVATTVVEVGVDVPEASVMLVHHAERFGLAQLHQLRGRVGRGSRASRCYLETSSEFALQKLQVMEQSQDGFLIAEADLDYRGAGELLGKRQHGKKALGCLRAAALPGDAQLLEHARAAARKTLIKYGMNPEDWPQPLLAALRDRSLPELDFDGLPEKSLAASGDVGLT